MRKLKRFGVWLLTLVFLMSTWPVMAAETEANAPQTAAFTDIATDNAVLPYVQYLKGKGILTGYPDGSYHPDAGLTRAEAAVVICRAANITPGAAGVSNFRDVYAGHWALAYINTAAQAGYLNGDPNGSFRPEQQLTRAEGLTLLFRLSSPDISQATLPALKDINNGHWAAKPVAAALAAGMAGLSSDGTQFMPDAVFTRINLAQALAIFLTEDPSLAKVALPGTLKTITGKITIQKAGSEPITVTKTAVVDAGDIITSVKGAKAEIDYPDGSSLLIKDDTVITVKAAEGKKYVKLDGSEGIAVDWLNVDIARGTMFGALADSRKKDGTTAYNPPVIATLASLNWDMAIRGYLAAATTTTQAQQPWYATAQTKKVKVQVDMPWGVAAIRGTFWSNLVSPGGGSTVNVLDGTVDVTSGGQTVSVGTNQTTGLTGAGVPPPTPTPAPPSVVQQFGQEGSWLQNTAQNMDQNQGVAPPPPPAPPTQGPTPPAPPAPTPPTPPPANTWQTLVQTIQSGGGTVNTDPTPPAPTTTSGGGSSGPSDHSGAQWEVDTGSTPDTITVYINNAKNTSGRPISGPATVTIYDVASPTTPLYTGTVTFTAEETGEGGAGHFSINKSVFGGSGTYTVGVNITGINNAIETLTIEIVIPPSQLIWEPLDEITGTNIANVTVFTAVYSYPPWVSYIDTDNKVLRIKSWQDYDYEWDSVGNWDTLGPPSGINLSQMSSSNSGAFVAYYAETGLSGTSYSYEGWSEPASVTMEGITILRASTDGSPYVAVYDGTNIKVGSLDNWSYATTVSGFVELRDLSLLGDYIAYADSQEVNVRGYNGDSGNWETMITFPSTSVSRVWLASFSRGFYLAYVEGTTLHIWKYEYDDLLWSNAGTLNNVADCDFKIDDYYDIPVVAYVKAGTQQRLKMGWLQGSNWLISEIPVASGGISSLSLACGYNDVSVAFVQNGVLNVYKGIPVVNGASYNVDTNFLVIYLSSYSSWSGADFDINKLGFILSGGGEPYELAGSYEYADTEEAGTYWIGEYSLNIYLADEDITGLGNPATWNEPLLSGKMGWAVLNDEDIPEVLPAFKASIDIMVPLP